MEHSYHIPHLPLPFDIETKAVMKQLISANRKLAELRGVAQTIPNENILISLKSATIIQYTIKGRFMNR